MATMKPIPLILRTARTSTIASSSMICFSCRSSLLSPFKPAFTRSQHSDDSPPSKPRPSSGIATLMDVLKPAQYRRTASVFPTPTSAPRSSAIPREQIFASIPRSQTSPTQPLRGGGAAALLQHGRGPKYAERGTVVDPLEQLFHMHIYATKHNTHITFTDPRKNAVVSASTGNLGFRKANRHTYDAAYQLAAHVFQKIEDKGLIPKKIEVVLRGFGVGREAVVKALLGKEGRHLKDAVVRVTDATRTKFGGTRSKKPRRL